MSTIPKEKDTSSVKGCPYCKRCTVGEDCPWCGKQSVCDLCGSCWTEGCGYQQQDDEIGGLLSERGQKVQEFGRRMMTPLPELLRERGA